jgi:hypothetical protein
MIMNGLIHHKCVCFFFHFFNFASIPIGSLFFFGVIIFVFKDKFSYTKKNGLIINTWLFISTVGRKYTTLFDAR